MTREEAVLILTRLEKGCDEYAGLTNYAKEAFQMAIEALSNPPVVAVMCTCPQCGCGFTVDLSERSAEA